MRYIQHSAGTLYEYTDVSAFAHCCMHAVQLRSMGLVLTDYIGLMLAMTTIIVGVNYQPLSTIVTIGHILHVDAPVC